MSAQSGGWGGWRGCGVFGGGAEGFWVCVCVGGGDEWGGWGGWVGSKLGLAA
jgi:hypothetical protein